MIAEFPSPAIVSTNNFWYFDGKDVSLYMDWIEINTYLNSASIKIPAENCSYFTSVTSNEINSLALYNISQFAEYNANFSFIDDPAKFGTNDCATHHICLLLVFFINMRPVVKIGVTEVTSSTMALGIGLIRFMITDNDGIKYGIQLDNVIYLSDSAKILDF